MMGPLPGRFAKLAQLLNVPYVILDMEFLLMVASNVSQESTAQDLLHVQHALQANSHPPANHLPAQHAHLEVFHLRDHQVVFNVQQAHIQLEAIVFNVQQALFQHL